MLVWGWYGSKVKGGGNSTFFIEVFMYSLFANKNDNLPFLAEKQILFIELWSDGSRLVVHTELSKACDSVTNHINTLDWVSTYTVFADSPTSDCVIQFNLSDSLRVMVLQVFVGDPISVSF